MNWSLILEGAKKEASRQYTEMAKWLEHQEESNPEGLDAFGLLPDAIRKAKSYRTRIYNVNKEIKAIDKKLESVVDNAEKGKLQDSRANYEFDQYVAAGRILKIYCIVIANVSLTLHDEQADHRTPVEDVYEAD
jgi:hypothetical protein